MRRHTSLSEEKNEGTKRSIRGLSRAGAPHRHAQRELVPWCHESCFGSAAPPQCATTRQVGTTLCAHEPSSTTLALCHGQRERKTLETDKTTLVFVGFTATAAGA